MFDEDFGISEALTNAGVKVVPGATSNEQSAQYPADNDPYFAVGDQSTPAAPAAQDPYATPAAPAAQDPYATPAAPAAQDPYATPAAPAAQDPYATPAAPAAQDPYATPAAPAAQDPQTSLMAQNMDLLRQMYAQQSQTSADRIAELEARLAAYESPAAKAAHETPWYTNIDVPELTDAQKAQFSASLPIIEAIARREAVNIAKTLESQRIDPLRQNIQETLPTIQQQQQALAKVTQDSVVQQVRHRLPWLNQAQDTPEYAQYYHATVPGTGRLTRKLLVEQALQVGDVDAVVDLLSGFKPSSVQTSPQQVSPGRTHTVNPAAQMAAPQTAGKKAMRLSQYNHALQEFTNGRMSPAKFSQLEDAWFSAVLNGTAIND